MTKIPDSCQEDLKLLYLYPGNTAGSSDKTGSFYHNLSDKNIAALDCVRSWMKNSSYTINDISLYGLHPDLTFLRYLRANNFDWLKAVAQIEATIKWRNELDMPSLMKMDPADIIKCRFDELMGVYPHWHCGFDKTGRPVLYKQYGYFDTNSIKKLTSMENVIRYHAWEQDYCMKLCATQSHSRKEIIETNLAIVDIEHMRLSQITSDFLAMVKALAAIDQAHYPETLGRIFIINTPGAFPIVWRIIKPWLNPIVAAKIQIFSSKKDWFPVLDEYIGSENLPENYGGALSNLSRQLHPYFHGESYSPVTSAASDDDSKVAEHDSRFRTLSGDSEQQSVSSRLTTCESVSSSTFSMQKKKKKEGWRKSSLWSLSPKKKSKSADQDDLTSCLSAEDIKAIKELRREAEFEYYESILDSFDKRAAKSEELARSLETKELLHPADHDFIFSVVLLSLVYFLFCHVKPYLIA